MNELVLIADDEPLARRTLQEHLRSFRWSGVILEAGDGNTAIELARRRHPDLIFLDIVMPGATGIQVLERLDYEPKVIFTTAHDQYAVTAFELGALDYLLKPFGRERLERVLRRMDAFTDNFSPVAMRAQESLGRTTPFARIFVRDGRGIVPITVDSIERVQGADDYVIIFTDIKQYLVPIRLSDIEARLGAEKFLRVHRSHLVNLDYISSIEPCDASRMYVRMKGGATITASRNGSKRLKDLVL